MWQVLSNGYGSCVGGIVAIGVAGVMKWLLELCWWVCSYCCGSSHRIVMGAVLVGV